MYSKIISALSCVALLASCASVEGPDSNGVEIAFKNETGKQFVAGLQPTKVELKRGEEDRKLPAQCSLDSANYSATFTAPAVVNIPAYSQNAVAATLTCERDGETYSETFQPENLSRKSRNSSAAAVGILLCPICGIGMAIGNSSNNNKREGDIFGFSEMILEI